MEPSQQERIGSGLIKVLDLFSGIGGFTLAGQMTGGFETVAFCEINPYCQKVLSKNFPRVPIFNDVTTLTVDTLRNRGIGQVDAVFGGFPCQDISAANPHGRGLEGKRSGLFYELMRIVRECRPRYVVLENVAALLSKHKGRDMGTVLWELSESGYDAEWQVISAASVGAPHLRERVFIVAYRDSQRCNNGSDYWEGRHLLTDPDRTAKAASSQRSELQSVARAMGKINANSAMPQDRGQLYPNLERSGTTKTRLQNKAERDTNTNEARKLCLPSGRIDGKQNEGWWTFEPSVGRVADGIPHRVDRIRGLGNAVVPQVAAIALQRVIEIEEKQWKSITK